MDKDELIQDFITAACHALAWNYDNMPIVYLNPGGKLTIKRQPTGAYETSQCFVMLIGAVQKAKELGYSAPQIISPIPSNGWTIDLSQLPTQPIRQLPPSEIQLEEKENNHELEKTSKTRAPHKPLLRMP